MLNILPLGARPCRHDPLFSLADRASAALRVGVSGARVPQGAVPAVPAVSPVPNPVSGKLEQLGPAANADQSL